MCSKVIQLDFNPNVAPSQDISFSRSFLVLDLNIPYPVKPLSPRQTGMVGAPTQGWLHSFSSLRRFQIWKWERIQNDLLVGCHLACLVMDPVNQGTMSSCQADLELPLNPGIVSTINLRQKNLAKCRKSEEGYSEEVVFELCPEWRQKGTLSRVLGESIADRGK